MTTTGLSPRIKSRSERKGILTTLFASLLLLCIVVDSVSCRWSPSKGNIVGNDGQHGNIEPDRSNAEFGLELSTDNAEFYNAIHALDLDEIVKVLENASSQSQLKPSLGGQRYKRSATFGRDNRRQVSTSIEAQMLPYVASVKIKPAGCSGTLIGPKYVLTAAHCVYSGPRKRVKKKKVKVGFLQRNGKIRWRKVRKFHVPREWRRMEKHVNRIAHDYAVLELKRAHRRSFMTPVPNDNSVLPVLQINGFPGDKKPNTMWHTRCHVTREWYGFWLSNCNLVKGMSGAGAYQWTVKGSYTTGGIVVASVKLGPPSRKYSFNVVNPLTREKTSNICKWMKAGDDCKSFPR